MKKLENRRTELDFLRLAAILVVIATHLCGGPVKSLDTASGTFAQLNCLRAAVTWDVPVFVMISGCLFLAPEKEVSIGKIFKKYIWHLAVCFAVWSAVFQVYYYVTSDTHLNLNGIFSEFLMGPYPFWYLFMLAGLYMIIPFLRSFAQDRKLVRYFLILFFVGEFLVNYGVRLPGIGPTLDQIIGKSNFHFALGFTGYYLLGHYLSGSRISLKKELLLYAAGIGCVIFTCAATTWQSRAQGVYNEWFSKYLMPNVIVESTALFVFFTKRVSQIRFSQRTRSILKNLSGLGFGVYLVHALVIEGFNLMGITVLRFAPLPAALILTVAVYAISLGLTWAIRQIPVIGKRIT